MPIPYTDGRLRAPNSGQFQSERAITKPKSTPKSKRVSDIRTLIRGALDKPERNDFVDTRRVTPKEAARISELTGENVEGFIHVIEASAIQHILEGHGRDKHPMDLEDIARIPEITRDAEITEQEVSDRGTRRIRYEKNENGYVFVVEEVRRGRRKLGLVTAFKTGGGHRKKAGVTPGEPDTH